VDAQTLRVGKVAPQKSTEEVRQMNNEPKRDPKQAELSLLKVLFPHIFGEHEFCVICSGYKGAQDAIYPLSQLTQIGEDYYCSEHASLFPSS